MRIYVDLYGMRDANYKVPDIKHKTENANYLVRRLQCRVPDEIAAEYRIGERMQKVSRNIRRVAEQMEEIYQVTNLCIDQYAEAERENSRNAEAFC